MSNKTPLYSTLHATPHKSSSTSNLDLLSDLIWVPPGEDKPSQEEEEHSRQHTWHHILDPDRPFTCKTTH